MRITAGCTRPDRLSTANPWYDDGHDDGSCCQFRGPNRSVENLTHLLLKVVPHEQNKRKVPKIMAEESNCQDDSYLSG